MLILPFSLSSFSSESFSPSSSSSCKTGAKCILNLLFLNKCEVTKSRKSRISPKQLQKVEIVNRS